MILLALICCWLIASPSVLSTQQPKPLLQAHTLLEDFQHDSLGQFASYPPVQDVGYEPSLTPSSEYDAPGGRALMRVVQPTRTGPLRFGFIRQTFLVMSDGGRLVFSYRLNQAGDGDQIEIGLAGADGCRYLRNVRAVTGKWVRTEVSLADFRCANEKSLNPGTAIEAIYIVADLKRADADIAHRFLIDDLALSAARNVRLEVHQPPTTWLESQNALVSAKSLSAGETVSLSVTAPVSLKNLDCALQDQTGKAVASEQLFDDGTHGDERSGDGRWANRSLYVLRSSDAAGVWTIKLRGETANREQVTTNVRFVHRKAESPGHPRLYFSSTEKQQLIERTREPRMAPLWEKIREEAKTRRGTGELSEGSQVFDMLDKQHLLPSLLAYFDVLNRGRLRIEANSLVAYLQNDLEARDAAKKALIEVAKWSRWEPPWFTEHGQHTYYPAGQLAAVVAFGYDLLYDQLTPAERSLVRRALIEKSIIPVYKEYVLDNRVLANTSNWIGHTVGGALIGASAIIGDATDDETRGELDLYVNGLLLKMERHLSASYLSDGSYGEGISYQEFDLETTAPALVALDRVLGVGYWNQTQVADSLTYPLYVLSRPIATSPDMGDSHPPSGRTIAPLVNRKKDPTLNWFYGQFAHSSIIDFLFPVDSAAVQSPQLPSSRIFHQKGNAVFRAGWAKDDPVMLFRAGANFNHNHADQGSFLLSAFGETLVSEAGWSDYYKDPYYTSYFTQAIGHNTVLVDGNPESQSLPDTPQFSALDSYPRITHGIASEYYDSVTADLSSVYRNRLKSYTRSLVFIKPDYFVIYDELTTNGDPAKFEWLLHLPDRARIKSSQGLALYSADSASLAIRMLNPENSVTTIREGRLPYATFATATPKSVPQLPAILNMATARASSSTHFLVALVPARTRETAQSLASRMTRINGSNFVGLRTERSNGRDNLRDIVVFRTNATNNALSFEEWMTDAGSLATTQSGDRLQLFAAQNARTLTKAGRPMFTSDNPTNVAVKYATRTIEASIHAETQIRIELFTGTKPRRVFLDGREAAISHNPTAATIAVVIPRGEHQLMIELH